LEGAGKSNTGAYIEVVTDTYAASPLAMKLHDAVKTLYRA
jgi:indolepyruvate decarboxylase